MRGAKRMSVPVITVDSWDGVSPIPLTELPTKPCPNCRRMMAVERRSSIPTPDIPCDEPDCDQGFVPVERGDRVVVEDTTDCPGCFNHDFSRRCAHVECGGSGRVSRRRTATITDIAPLIFGPDKLSGDYTSALDLAIDVAEEHGTAICYVVCAGLWFHVVGDTAALMGRAALSAESSFVLSLQVEEQT